MLLSKEVEMQWSNKIKSWYISKGYNYTGINTRFMVRVEDLQPQSNKIVEAECDYCGCIFTLDYSNYLRGMDSVVSNVSCKNCLYIKVKESNIEKYGVACVFELEDIKQRTKQSNMNKYGVEFAAQRPEIIQKCINTNIKKYGVSWYMQTAEFKLAISGEKHVNWNPNLTEDERVDRRDYDAYIQWRKAVYQRDGYTCQCCKIKKGKIINAHHLDGYNWCKERRLDISNGITLCNNCHALDTNSFHRMYGFGNNTESQFKEWIALIKK